MSGQIFILHGSVEDWDASRQAMRHYVPEHSLRSYLSDRSELFVDPDDGMNGDILTVDDSTRGAARACLVARQLGHAVTLFVNPSQINSGRDYWFSRFDALIDARQVEAVVFNGVTYSLQSKRELRAFRFAARAHLVVSTEGATHRLLDEIEVLLGAQGAEVCEHARSIGLDDIAMLHRAGVRMGSHGWDHQCISSLSPDEQHTQLVETKNWLRGAIGREPRDYAVPFGQERLDARARAEVPGMVYLVDSTLPPEAAGEGYRYRRNLSPILQEGFQKEVTS
jgi:peptidoglycan/xylan/chitin deacetylase (PgdA/CDA1 family)